MFIDGRRKGLEAVRGEGRSQVLLAELRKENLASPALVDWKSWRFAGSYNREE